MYTTKVKVSIKSPTQTIDRVLEIPDLEVETLIDDILTQCEQYEESSSDDLEEDGE